MKKLIAKIKNWFVNLLIEVKNDLMASTKKQWYVVVMAVVFIIATTNFEYWIGTIFSLLFIVMVAWWALVKFEFVKKTPIDPEN